MLQFLGSTKPNDINITTRNRIMRLSIYTLLGVLLLTISASSIAQSAADTTAPQATISQDKMATYRDLSLKFNAEAMKIPAYAQNIKAMQDVLAKAAACQMGGGTAKACAEAQNPELDRLGKDMLKIIKESVNNGNTALKDALDNLNSFAKANGLETININ
jgi:hypothetical protein